MRNSSNSGRAPRSLFAFVGVVLGVMVALFVRAVVVEVFLVPSASMAPTLRVGDRVVVDKLSGLWRPVRIGDVVVFDATDVWTPATDGLLIAKRVIAVAGDRIRCCSADGRLVRNGFAVDEPYVLHGAGTRRFDVVVPAGRMWVMGDDRARSLDSAAHLDTSGGGSVPVSHLVGRVIGVVWPPAHAGILGSPEPKDAHDPA